jgi:hypothetical protein
LAHALDAAQVLGRALELLALAGEDHDLEADVALEVYVARGADVLAPAVLGRGEPALYVRGPVVVEDHDGADGIGLRVPERLGRRRLTDEEADRLGAVRRIPHRDPTVEGGERLGVEGDRRADRGGRHRILYGETAGGAGPKPILS